MWQVRAREESWLRSVRKWSVLLRGRSGVGAGRLDWVRHLGGPGRLYDPAEGSGVVYFVLLSTFLPAERKKQNFKIHF